MSVFYFDGRELDIAERADIPNNLRPDGLFGKFVQQTLDGFHPDMLAGAPRASTSKFDGAGLLPAVIELPRGYKRTWGVHRGHHAIKAGLSPFVHAWAPDASMNLVTVELKLGDRGRPVLTRAYTGDYTPPLPWMTSASDARNGVAGCLTFWKRNVYLSHTSNHGLIKMGTRTYNAPRWFNGR